MPASAEDRGLAPIRERSFDIIGQSHGELRESRARDVGNF
jgi:hypothetical protein